MKTTVSLILITLLIACTTQKPLVSKKDIYWVNSLKVSCTGVVPMKCLQIQKSKTIEKGRWQNLHSAIDGFSFEPGYIYKLSVKEEKIDPAKVPADGSLYKLTLIEILEKIPDPKFRIHDIWALEAIDGVSIQKPNKDDLMHSPSIEINLTEMRIMGTDGCNNFQGSIETIEADELKFGPVATTMKMCPDMEIPDKFNAALFKVARYRTESLKLFFLDEKGTELLRFKKVD